MPEGERRKLALKQGKVAPTKMSAADKIKAIEEKLNKMKNSSKKISSSKTASSSSKNCQGSGKIEKEKTKQRSKPY